MRDDEAPIFEQTARLAGRLRRAPLLRWSSTSCTPTAAPPAPRSRCCCASCCHRIGVRRPEQLARHRRLRLARRRRAAHPRLPAASSSAAPAAGSRCTPASAGLPADPQITPALDGTAAPSSPASADARPRRRRRRRRRAPPRRRASHAADLAAASSTPAARPPTTDHRHRRTSELAARPGPGTTRPDARRALTGALAALAQDARRRLPVRAHYFFRVERRLVGVLRPATAAASSPSSRTRARAVGKLYPQPRIRCDCGARCLDLLCCQTCGELLLGGYAAATTRHGGGVYLLPGACPTSRRSPDRSIADQTCTATTRCTGPTAATAAQPHARTWPALDVPLRVHAGRARPRPRARCARRATASRRTATCTRSAPRRPASARRSRHPRAADPLPELRRPWERTGTCPSPGRRQAPALPVTSSRRMRTPIWRMRDQRRPRQPGAGRGAAAPPLRRRRRAAG